MQREQKSHLALTNLQSIADLLSKAVLACAGLCFASGALIVSLHLGSLGVADSGFLKSQYVATGAVFVLLNGAGSAFWLSLGFVGRNVILDWSRRRRFASLLLLFLPLVFGMFTAALVAMFRGDWMQMTYLGYWQYQTGWTATFAVLVCAFPVVAAVVIVRHFWAHEAQDNSDGWRTMLAMQVLFSACLAGTVPLSVYTAYVYPLLDQGYGGGRPVIAKLILRPEAFSDRPETRRLLSNSACEILSETGDSIVVRPVSQPGGTSAQSIVSVRRELVSAVMRKAARAP